MCRLVLVATQQTRERQLAFAGVAAQELEGIRVVHYSLMETIARTRGEGITGWPISLLLLLLLLSFVFGC